MNIADRYHGKAGLKEWLDFAILIKGPECAHVLLIVKRLWNRTFISRKERSRETVHHPALYEENVKVKVLQNNWYRNKIEILEELSFSPETCSEPDDNFCQLFFTRKK
jgi:hypothetical protein